MGESIAWREERLLPLRSSLVKLGKSTKQETCKIKQHTPKKIIRSQIGLEKKTNKQKPDIGKSSMGEVEGGYGGEVGLPAFFQNLA